MAAQELKVLMVGATGRLGLAVKASLKRREARGEGKSELVGGICAPNDPLCGKDLDGVPLASAWDDRFAGANVIIDFSSPAGAKTALKIAAEKKLPMLLATTGLGADVESALAAATEVVPVIRTANTSVGINSMLDLVAQAAKLVGANWDVEIVELHRRGKKDAPSGTALSLGRSVAEARGQKFESVLQTTCSGTDVERKPGEIGIQAIRGGDIAGEHTVYFITDGERLEITHRVKDPSTFAEGALRAAAWLVNQKKPGLYAMKDVLRA